MKTTLALALALVTSAYADPGRLAAKLAKERVTGTAIVDGRLYATEANARAATGEKTGALIAVRVLEDRGAVLRVSTEIPRGSDCVAPLAGYDLTVFVRRTDLVPRLTRTVSKRMTDGTAIVIDRGAPIEITVSGLAWRDKALDPAGPPPEAVAYSLTSYTAGKLPSTGVRVACSPPMTKAEWLEKRRNDDPGASRTVDDSDVPWCGVSEGSRYYEAPVMRAGDAYFSERESTCARRRVRVEADALDEPGIKLRTRKWPGFAVHGPVYWPDGTIAGRYTANGRVYYPSSIKEIDGRSCISIAEVESAICHPSADMKIQ